MIIANRYGERHPDASRRIGELVVIEDAVHVHRSSHSPLGRKAATYDVTNQLCQEIAP